MGKKYIPPHVLHLWEKKGYSALKAAARKGGRKSAALRRRQRELKEKAKQPDFTNNPYAQAKGLRVEPPHKQFEPLPGGEDTRPPRRWWKDL